MKARALLACFSISGTIHASPADAVPELLRPMVREYCTACHNAEKTEGELDLDALIAQPEKLWGDGKLLERVREVVAERDMPPKKAKKPLGDTARAQLTELLDRGLTLLAAAQQDDPGDVVMPRLNKAEYRNVLRDLSGGVLHKAGEYLPNEGGAGEGFANVGEAQSMSPAVLEKFLEAARGALRYLRASPADGLVWSTAPRDPVDEPAAARREAVDDLIAWHVEQQQKWGRLHRDDLQARIGCNDAAYLEAAWQYRWRAERGKADSTFAELARSYEVPLAPVVLEKWFSILSATDPQPPFAEWARAWQALDANATNVRARCIEIVAGATSPARQSGPAAPPYEVSFHEAITEVTGSATARGVWPFRIAIGEATELFFVVTDAGDGNRGEYATWRAGRFQMADGTARPWQEVSKVTGVNSGREFPFGRHGRDGRALPPDQIGVQPPGALRVSVPPGAVTFELELALDADSLGKASVQAMVLKEKPSSQSYIPGRMVFGGKPSGARAAKQDTQGKALLQTLRKRNIAEANVTKIGLSAERNVLAHWTRSSLEHVGGPWPTHLADKEEPLAPYHLTVQQVRRNATPEGLATLRMLEDRLAAIVQAPQQELLALLKRSGIETAKEGALPGDAMLAALPHDTRSTANALRETILAGERALAETASAALVDFACRAWRRELEPDERELLTRLYRDARAQGVSFDSAMKSPLLVVLASPHFVYRGESSGSALSTAPGAKAGDPAQTMGRPATVALSSPALASRLSFFLWASIPDGELLAADLRDPSVLRAQTSRMLRDPRSLSLATDFAAQLWDFAGFEHFTGPDAQRFPEFTPALRQKMLDDVVAALREVFAHDRPLSTLLDEHCLATMPLFLTKTSLPLRTSPVQRGVWLMEKVLGRELPNPPANVPPLSDDEKNAAGLNIRQQLEKHRADATCASCHDKIDPLGIALEHYDPIGRWRTADRDGTALAASATTHDGVHLDGPDGLRRYLRTRQEEFLRHFHRKLLGYALGRAVLPGDRALLDRMSSAQTGGGQRFPALVEAIVTSPQFTHRRAPSSATASREWSR